MISGKKNKKIDRFINDKSYKQLAILCIIQPLAIFPWLGIYASLSYVALMIISSIILAAYGYVVIRSKTQLITLSRWQKLVIVIAGIMSGFISLAGLLHILSLAVATVPELYFVLSMISTWIIENWFMNPFVVWLWVLLGVSALLLAMNHYASKTKLAKKLHISKRFSGVSKSRVVAALSLIVLALTLLALGGLGTGKLKYGLAYVGCFGPPIEASRFMASYTYNLPTDKAYQPSIFSEYFCTEAEAKQKGFRHSVLSDAAKQEAEKVQAERKEAERFSPEKINYTLYVPDEKYTFGEIKLRTMSGTNLQSFFNVKEDGYRVASVREGARPNSYELCRDEEYTCSSIGKDVRGVDVMKQVAGRKGDIISYSVNIGNTFIILSGVYSELTEADVISIFNSLKEYGNG